MLIVYPKYTPCSTILQTFLLLLLLILLLIQPLEFLIIIHLFTLILYNPNGIIMFLKLNAIQKYQYLIPPLLLIQNPVLNLPMEIVKVQEMALNILTHIFTGVVLIISVLNASPRIIYVHRGIISVGCNKGIRIYDPYADNRFRSLLCNTDKGKGSVTHRSHIFTDTYILPPSSAVCDDGKRSITIDNAGGKSDISEMYSIDYFTQMYEAKNTIFEKEVNYWIDYKMVDFICTIDSHRVGVSVARAMGYPTSDKFTPHMASKLLYKKLYGLIVARNAVVKSQSFFKSILHIWCQDTHVADLLRDAFSNLDDNDYGLDVKGILLLQLTVCDDPQLYKNFIR